MIVFRPPTPADVKAIAANMRAYDKLECAVAGLTPQQALEEGVAGSDWAVTAEVDEVPVCMFGVRASDDLLSDQGHPWMLCVDGIEAHVRHLVRYTRGYLEAMGEEFQTLSNLVHADNVNAIRFIRWCGFQLGAPVTVKGEAFLPFEKRAA